MSPNVAPVFSAAKSLSVEEQQELIDLLEEQMDAIETEPPQLSDEWKAEADRRLAEYDAGLAKSVSWEEIQQRW